MSNIKKGTREMSQPTANELADELIKINEYYNLEEEEEMVQAATMLRQQVEEINNLKQWQNRQLDVIKNLEAQLYGGNTK